MSERPTWEADEREFAAARAAGWREADLRWESASERAIARAEEGDWKAANALWTGALDLAREFFLSDDPRLGVSWANSAAAPVFQNRKANAAALEAARRAWTRGPAWIDRMKMERVARSSVHHMRMEAKNRGIYESAARRRLHDFAAEARETLEHLAAGGDIEPHSLRRWRAEKPPIYGDTRKLLSACLLLSFRPRRRKA